MGIKGYKLLVLLLGAALLAVGCGDQDPGVLGGGGIDELSAEGQRQEYNESVGRALQQLGTAQGESFGRAIENANKKQLQQASIAWEQGVQQLKQVNPPKDAVEAHTNLVESVSRLATWNKRLVQAAPNKTKTRNLARQAGNSDASKLFEASVCTLVDIGYGVVSQDACGTPLSNAETEGSFE